MRNYKSSACMWKYAWPVHVWTPNSIQPCVTAVNQIQLWLFPWHMWPWHLRLIPSPNFASNPRWCVWTLCKPKAGCWTPALHGDGADVSQVTDTAAGITSLITASSHNNVWTRKHTLQQNYIHKRYHTRTHSNYSQIIIISHTQIFTNVCPQK